MADCASSSVPIYPEQNRSISTSMMGMGLGLGFGFGAGHCVPNGTVASAKLSSFVPPRRRFRPVAVRAASTPQSQIVDVKRLKGIRMRPRTPEDDEKKVRVAFGFTHHRSTIAPPSLHHRSIIAPPSLLQVPPSVEYLVEYVSTVSSHVALADAHTVPPLCLCATGGLTKVQTHGRACAMSQIICCAISRRNGGRP